MQKNNKIKVLMALPAALIMLITPFLTFAQQQAKNDDVNSTTRVTCPGTNISIAMPDVFIYMPAQSAYIYAGAAASISIRALNGTPCTSLLKGMTKAQIESQGMELVESYEASTASGLKGMMYIASLKVQSAGSDEKVGYERLIFIAGSGNNSIWVTANYPVITKSLLGSVLRNCLLTVEYND